MNLLYILGAQQIGFVITGVIYLTSMMAVLRVPLLRAFVLGVVMTLIIHFVFYKLLARATALGRAARRRLVGPLRKP